MVVILVVLKNIIVVTILATLNIIVIVVTLLVHLIIIVTLVNLDIRFAIMVTLLFDYSFLAIVFVTYSLLVLIKLL